MITFTNFLDFKQMPVQSRALFSGIAISCYWFLLYQYFPKYMFDLTYFFLPLIASVCSNIALLKLSKNSKAPKGTVRNKKEETPSTATNANQPVLNQQPSTLQKIDEQKPAEVGVQEVKFDTAAMEQVIEQKMSAVTAEVAAIREEMTASRNDMNNIKNDMGALKTGLQELSNTFETTLTDLKAFQAEIANPLNFMRKYVESIDIKNLSDPALPLANLQQASNNQSTPVQDSDVGRSKVPTPQPIVETRQAGKGSDVVEEKDITFRQTVPHTQPTVETRQAGKGSDVVEEKDITFRQIFSGSLTTGKMMAVISLIGEILQKSGPDSVNLLIEQCKLMGLKPDDEQMIYNIVNMLNKSGVPVNDMLIMVYRFAKIIGINDKEADIHYAKLIANKSGGVSSITASTELIPRNRD